MKGTTFRRLYFQLAPSALPTGGTGFGLLPTPVVNPSHRELATNEDGKVESRSQKGDRYGITLYQMGNHGLLSTPRVSDITSGRELEVSEDGSASRVNQSKTQRYGANLADLANYRLLPTPQARDMKNGSKPSSGRVSRKMEQGWSLNLNDLAAGNLLPTPTNSMATPQDFIQAGYHSSKRPEYSKIFMPQSPLLPPPSGSEAKGTGPKGSRSNDHRLERDYLDAVIVEEFGTTGTTSQLSGRFVMEMMGFPPSWVEEAFVSLARKSLQAQSTSSHSREAETPSSRRLSYKSSVLLRIVGKATEHGE